MAARHVDEKFELSEQLEKSKACLDQAVKERVDEIAELKLLVGQHAAETLEARTLLQVIAACGERGSRVSVTRLHESACVRLEMLRAFDFRAVSSFGRIAVVTL